MLTECETTELLLYWQNQLKGCQSEFLKAPIKLVIKVLEEVLEKEE